MIVLMCALLFMCGLGTGLVWGVRIGKTRTREALDYKVHTQTRALLEAIVRNENSQDTVLPDFARKYLDSHPPKDI